MLRYQDLVTSVAERIAITVDEARAAAQATIAALAHSLDGPDRTRLLAAMPATVRDAAGDAPGPALDVDAFVSEVSWLTGATPEQSRYRAQAVLATIAEHEPGLLASLNLPDDLPTLAVDPAPGGGITGPTGHAAPLTADEVAGFLAELPDWSGDRQALRRTLTLPSNNLDRVLAQVELLGQDLGRGPEIVRDGDTARISVRTHSVDAVTTLDVDLAHEIDDRIAEAAAGIA